MLEILPGVWKLVLGDPECISPLALRAHAPAAAGLEALSPALLPLTLNDIAGQATARGFVLTLPLAADEQLFGFGLQLGSFNQRGKKKMLRVNSDPTTDLGDSHAPAPFYVSTAGYGVFIDTARYATVYCGVAQPRGTPTAQNGTPTALSTDELYIDRNRGAQSQVMVEIPLAQGVEVYLFAGPDLRSAVQRYNLFCGGGAFPPRWGLGVWYRVRSDYTQQQTLALAEEMREDAMPCDVLGLEPGWQSHAYPCSFLWNDTYPDPALMITTLQQQGYRVNVWTHAFVHDTSPIYESLQAHAGDFLTFGGLTPDLLDPEARRLIAELFARTHVDIGVSGYKLDECDNSDYTGWPWSFPETSTFPSGADGEQMHTLFGLHFQESIWSIFRRRNQRTYSQVRSSTALASPYPFVLYSDLYGHREFIRGVANQGFCGLLWSPEVRDAASREDLLRRLQSVMLSPQALVNAWYIKHPPWKQWNTEANNHDQLLDNWQSVTASCRDLFQLRMRLIPYLHSAFYRYFSLGMPPFRALVMDYPEDRETWNIDNQYLIGEVLMAAPVIAGETARAIYLPEGEWVDFWTNDTLPGGQWITRQVPLEIVPIYVKQHALLPLAQPTQHTGDPDSLLLTVRVYGNGSLPAQLVEEDNSTYNYEHGAVNILTLRWNAAECAGSVTSAGDTACPHYTIAEWETL